MSTFRLASYSPDRLRQTVAVNLETIRRLLAYNAENRFLFFRLSSDIVPFGSHPVCGVPWQSVFADTLAALGRFIRSQGMRISMHPDQFTLLNSPGEEIFQRSAAELAYHADLLDGLGLDAAAKIQIHVGGVYGDKPASLRRFAERYPRLPLKVRRRLVIENDEWSYSLEDCLFLHRETGVPVLWDSFHHELHNRGERFSEAVQKAGRTWSSHDGPPMVDYSSQAPGERRGKHAETLDPRHFRRFLNEVQGHALDIMLEIKDKEASAHRAVAILRKSQRAGPVATRTRA
jgi:UV DNA damage endonuclease